jgi:hypothetical protein
MFPWSPEFVWDVAHLLFFGAFYAVVAVVGAMLLRATLQARKNAGQAASVAWHAEFQDLPSGARACRHQLTGEAPDRTCDNAFDCRSCAVHPSFVRRRAATGPAGPGRSGGPLGVDHFGLSMPSDRFYHRGHTWVRPEADGTVTVGLDDLGKRLVGNPATVDLPVPGTSLVVNGCACRMATGATEVRVLSPVEGQVVAARGEGNAWTLKVRPTGALDTRHLLSGDEVRPFVLRELERLERALGSKEVGLALADGGEVVQDLGRVLPRAAYDTLLGEMFLEA